MILIDICIYVLDMQFDYSRALHPTQGYNMSGIDLSGQKKGDTAADIYVH
jgi:hypothetical protein